MRDGGKGDKQRPLSIPMEEFNSKWDAIFGAAEKKKQKEKQLSVDIEASRDDVSIMVNLTEKF